MPLYITSYFEGTVPTAVFAHQTKITVYEEEPFNVIVNPTVDSTAYTLIFDSTPGVKTTLPVEVFVEMSEYPLAVEKSLTSHDICPV